VPTASVIANFSGDLSGFTGTVLVNGTANYVGLSGNAASLLSGSNAKWVVTTATNRYLYPSNVTTSSTIALGEVSGSGNLGSAQNQNNTWEIGALSTSSTFSGRIMNNNVSGTGVAILRKVGSGTLTLTGSNTYTGGTQLNGGVLGLGNANALSSSGAISFGGGTLQFSSANTTDYSSRFSTAAGQAYSLDTNGENVTVGTALSSSGGTLTKHGLGALTLSAANTYTGDTILSAGTLKLGSGGSFANSPLIVVGDAGSNGAVLDLTAKSTFAIGAGQTLKGKGTVLLGPSTALTINGLLSPGNSPGLLTYDGGGTVTLSGTTLMEVWGTIRGANPGYDAIDLINGTDLIFGGILNLDFNQTFANSTSFNLFTPDGTSTLAGNFSAITMVGSSYTDLTFTNNAGVWETNTGAANTSMSFNSATGTLSIIVVPEPSTLALAGLGLAAAAFASRRRRRCP
jgi:autotransporter-associated beta strand protein